MFLPSTALSKSFWRICDNKYVADYMLYRRSLSKAIRYTYSSLIISKGEDITSKNTKFDICSDKPIFRTMIIQWTEQRSLKDKKSSKQRSYNAQNKDLSKIRRLDKQLSEQRSYNNNLSNNSYLKIVKARAIILFEHK